MINLEKPKSVPSPVFDKMVQRMIESVCEAENLDIRIFKSKHKAREYVDPRQIYLAIMFDKFRPMGVSLARIGKTVNRDHATVLHAKRVVGDRIEVEQGYQSRVALIESLMDAVMRPWLYPNTREHLHTEIYKLKQKIEKYEQELRELDEMERNDKSGNPSVAVSN